MERSTLEVGDCARWYCAVIIDNYTVTGYYLVDGIYPNFSIFVKSLAAPTSEKEKLFVRMQEAVRKDVERAFGVLKGRWRILAHPCEIWDTSVMSKVMLTCIILHNMMVEEGLVDADIEPAPLGRALPALPREPPHGLRDELACLELRARLIEHVWHHHGRVLFWGALFLHTCIHFSFLKATIMSNM